MGDEHPEIRDRLIARWYAEAERNGVLPLSDGVMDRLAHLFLPWPTGASRVELRAGERVFEDNTPALGNGFTITAHLGEALRADTVGVLAEQGDYNGGWVWHVRDGELRFAVSFVSEYLTELSVPVPLGDGRLRWPAGRTTTAPVVAPGVGGDRRRRGDGTGRLPHEWPGLWTPNSSATLLAGIGRPLPVCDGYDPTVAFSEPRSARGRRRRRRITRRSDPSGRDGIQDAVNADRGRAVVFPSDLSETSLPDVLTDALDDRAPGVVVEHVDVVLRQALRRRRGIHRRPRRDRTDLPGPAPTRDSPAAWCSRPCSPRRTPPRPCTRTRSASTRSCGTSSTSRHRWRSAATSIRRPAGSGCCSRT